MNNLRFLILNKKQNILNDALIYFGSLWLIIESISYFFSNFSDEIEPYNIYIFLFSLVVSVTTSFFTNWPKRKILKEFTGSNFDVLIEVEDIFNTSGNIAITSSDYFDTTTDIASNKSLKSQLINTYYNSDVNELDTQIDTSLRNQNKLGKYNSRKYTGKKYKFDFGDTAIVPINNNKAFIVVLTEIYEVNGTKYTRTSYENLNKGLIPLWKSVRANGRMNDITVPVFCSGLSSLSLSHLILIQSIVLSFVIESKVSRVSPLLRIAIKGSNYSPREFEIIEDFLKTMDV